MKKNLMSVVILALVLANLILTAILMISVLPQTRKANELITKVCAAIDLDLTDGGSGQQGDSVPMDQVQTYSINSGETMTINLQSGEDGVAHYALLQLTLGLNTKHEDYKKYGDKESLADKEGMMKDKIFTVVGSHTLEEMRSDKAGIQQELLTSLQELYSGSTFIVSVSYTDTYQ